jgi:predicted PolB exonuclease-like 3'-5' exonuclease
MWSPDRDKRVSLDKLCKAFGIPGKGDFDGSMVADTWSVNPDKVIEYCRDDVARTRQVYNRLTFNLWNI